jgi:hypothetical protein
VGIEEARISAWVLDFSVERVVKRVGAIIGKSKCGSRGSSEREERGGRGGRLAEIA